MTAGPLHSRHSTIAIVAGEASGDHLGARLMVAITQQSDIGVKYIGVGGREMEDAGLNSLFAISEIAIMGPIAILMRLPALLRRIRQAADAIIAANPDVLVLVDCPEFSHRVARRVRAALPKIPVVDYVGPSVWAWRPGRARVMRGYIDTVMALLPFEPEVYQRLDGPECVYVGHSAVEQAPPPHAAHAQIRALRRPGRALLLVMPGSRTNEIKRLMGPFGNAVKRLGKANRKFDIIIPSLPHLEAKITALAAGWQMAPHLVCEPELRRAAMEAADVALVASGTATLELALAKTPMVVGYRAERILGWLRYISPAPSIVLANLIHGANAVPEFYHWHCTGRKLAQSLEPLMQPGPQRDAQLAAFDDIIGKIKDTARPSSQRAAEIVLNKI
ncbi:MAG: lipid-A-disaccharide synthase [Alphaproteobacteria bacterium]